MNASRHIATLAKAFSSLALIVGVTACSAPEKTPLVDETAAIYNTTLTNQELMALIIEPASDILWDSGGWVLDASGYEELYPTTDAGTRYYIGLPGALPHGSRSHLF